MASIGVEMPDSMPRVSEYVPEIIKFIETIIENGFAYESNGSVYFNVVKFIEQGHEYPKLNKSAQNALELLLEAEGKLTSEDSKTEKINVQDFALWKKSKENEPFWESPWGSGRPGWHIECSAMSTSIFRTKEIDIHAGGEDLKFPHHDNEIAQSEAYHNHNSWIKYFLHVGHLHIDKQKMSKSLKNFIKIKEFTKKYTASQLRFLFLLQKWYKIMNFDPETSMEEAVAKDTQFNEFFQQASAIVRNFDIKKHPQKWNDEDYKLNDKLRETKIKVHHHLCNSIDTPKVIKELSTLIVETNKYMKDTSTVIKSPIIVSVSQYISKILKAVGIISSDSFRGDSSDANVEKIIEPYVDVAVAFRDTVKQLAIKPDNKKGLIAACDAIRDVTFVNLGIRLEDTGMDTPSTWMKVDPEELKAKIEEKRLAKERAQKEKQEKAELEERKKSTPPNEYYATWESDKYSQFDEAGVPTHDEKGKELSKEIVNGLKKKVKAIEKKYEKYIQAQQKKAEKESKEGQDQ